MEDQNSTVQTQVEPEVQAVVQPVVEPVVQVQPVVEPMVQVPTQAMVQPQPQVSLQITTEQIMVVVNGIHDLLRGRKLSQALLIRVIANCMIMTARMEVSNHLKKQIVILALEKYIKEKSDLSQDETDLIMSLVDVMVSDAIDTLADVRKGTINLSNKACCVIC